MICREEREKESLNAGLVHEFGQLRQDQVVGAEKQRIPGVVVSITARLRHMVGAQGLIEGITSGGSVIGDGSIGGGVMMIVCVGRPGHSQQQRRGGAVEGLLHPGGSSVVCLVILTHHRLGTPIRGLVGGVLRGVCRVFVNVCEVREWSGPGVAA